MSVTGSQHQPLIDVRDLERTFDVRRRVEGRRRRVRDSVVAVHDLTFSVGAGEMVGYIGPNGAGKSTTIKMLTGILVPTGGQVRVAGLDPSREPQPGLVRAIYSWARGDRLDRALAAAAYGGAELSAGDFVRWCKQVLDLLEQLASVPAPGGEPEPIAGTARGAAAAVRRGVVAQSMQF